ncbi:hypothetical protein B0I35DRAFT_424823 [Stachybotrys elegans]|uniref:phosphatidylinositol-3,4,5-trisphosphate 3-phosphatase n=1 Tax=Stachybotrys elegans TaxID=80388 RepID=A0A8K0T300_9HYPO|nr:hypothetical protein B0I35DRAFT_424823 [Stachybotrys elegans]
MASILRQIVAGPRTRHPEAGLDLSYITDNIIATSGPSQTYPQRAYRNPLDRLVGFLDSKHGEDWAIWEFRAEGTGYPDHLVHGRVRHYPWPDHHPPPFRLIPMIMASMRNWLHGGELEGGRVAEDGQPTSALELGGELGKTAGSEAEKEERKKKRVVVVHCKAGKGRSGTISCSYLISEEGWKPEDALARFTERRMRPGFGAGVSIPSQLRWVTYVDRWTQGGKTYLDRPIEIVEIHLWGLRNGVKITVEGFINEGKKIEELHTFARNERTIVEGGAPESGGLGEMVWDMAGYSLGSKNKAPEEADLADSTNNNNTGPLPPSKSATAPLGKTGSKLMRKGTKLIQKVSTVSTDKRNTIDASPDSPSNPSDTAPAPAAATTATTTTNSSTATATIPSEPPSEQDPGGMAVILKAKTPVQVPTSDACVSVELRNRAHKSIGLTMVSAVAHVWFNAFFEGQGPERGGRPSDSGVFAIEWEAMDGIKGSSRKGARAFDRMAVVWRAAAAAAAPAPPSTTSPSSSSSPTQGGEARSQGAQQGEEVINQPAVGQPVPQTGAADWKGGNKEDASAGEKDLGLRTRSPASAEISKASSLKSEEGVSAKVAEDADQKSLEGVRSSGPAGEDLPAEINNGKA